MRIVSVIAAGLFAIAAPAAAQDYPTRPIRVITHSAAGGISDIFIRTIGEELHKRWGQPLVIENRPGGNMNIGGRACAEAAPDGYTICILANEVVTYNHHLYKSIPFNPEKNFEPITNLFFLSQAMVVNADLKVRNLAELVALAKARPKTLSYSSPAAPLTLFVENFNRENDVDLVRVPFRGGGDTVNGVLSGATPIAFVGLGNLIAHLRSGAMTGLVVDGDARSPLFPDIPTLREAGYRGPLTRSYFGLYAPTGMSKAFAVRIADDVRRIASDPAFRDKHLIQRGLEPVFNSPEEFAEFLKTDRVTAERVVREAGLTPQ
jgi:tripartite-type tricarboxylate transporter receptor subunit TctC